MFPTSPLFKPQYFYAVCLVFICLLSCLTGCKEDTIDPEPIFGRIEGQVLDARGGTGLANVTITTNPATVSVITDDEGRFEISGVPVGRVTITSKRTEYQQDITNVTVAANQTAMASIQLDKSTITTQPPSPSNNPRPADNAINQPTTVRFYWHPVNPVKADSLHYDVVLFESNVSGGRQIATAIKDTTAVADQLKFNTVYYWQVTVRNSAGGSARSNLWSFRTGPLPENRYLFVREVDGNTDIYSSNETGTTLQRLTSSAFTEKAPQLSPNRDRIAYTSNVTGQFQIYTMNRDGSDQRRITVLPVEGYHNFGSGYRWSPDGSQLIYAHYNELYRINRDGTGLTLVATAPADRHFRECDWTARGNRIAVQTIGANIFDSELYLMNADGSNRTQLIGNVPGQLNSPSFSIDGREILYTRDVAGFDDVTGRQLNAHIFQQRLDGPGLIDISAGVFNTTNSGKPLGTNDLYPRYSPDGSKVIFVNSINDGLSPFEIWTSDLEGRSRTRLFQSASLPDWK